MTDLAKLDFAPLGRQIEALGRAIKRVGEVLAPVVKAFVESIACIGRALSPVVEAEEHMRRFGPRNLTADGLWQTDACAGWLHDSCPSRHCDCTCHGGELR